MDRSLPFFIIITILAILSPRAFCMDLCEYVEMFPDTERRRCDPWQPVDGHTTQERTNIGPQDCYDVQQSGNITSGVYTIYPAGSEPFNVYCNMDTDGGGWTVFQRRQDGSVDFQLPWDDYVAGFGNLTGEHWLGNERLHSLTNQRAYRLRVDLEDFENETRYAVYESFVVADSSDMYRLTLGNYTGDAGDGMRDSEGQRFSTPDNDNDSNADKNCAAIYRGGWWFESCHNAHPNGLYLAGATTDRGQGVQWRPWKNYKYSLKFTEMKLKPVSL